MSSSPLPNHAITKFPELSIEIVGDQFLVNDFLNGAQSFQSIDMNNAGDFVITWESWDNQDGSSSGIFAKRYDDTGNQLGDEFQVNTFFENSQITPDVVLSDERNFVITWSSKLQDGSGLGIFAQRFNSDGELIGSEFQVNTFRDNDQKDPSIDMDESGNFMVTWSSYGLDSSGMGIFAQKYSSDGIPIDSESQINNHFKNHQHNSSMSMNKAGNYIVAWGSNCQTNNDSSYDIYAQFSRVDHNPSITPTTTPTPTETVTITMTPSPTPKVDIFSNALIYVTGDQVNIEVDVYNNSLEEIDFYAALKLGNVFYWFPQWKQIPYNILIDEEFWHDIIASFICNSSIPRGDYTFYAAICKTQTYDVIGLDILTISIN